MRRIVIGSVVGLVLIGLITYFVINSIPKPWPSLPDYPANRAQQYNRQTTGDDQSRVTTFEINHFPGDGGYRAAYFDYQDVLQRNHWDQFYPEPLTPATQYDNWYSTFKTGGNDGIWLFGQNFLATCSAFALEMQIEQLDAATGHMRITLRETRTHC